MTSINDQSAKLLKALKYGVKAKLKYPNKAAMSTSGDYLCAAWILAKMQLN